MKLHSNAKTCPRSRSLLVTRVLSHGWSRREAAEAAGVSERTASKWLARYRLEGEASLLDRSWRPRRSPSQTSRERVAVIAALRRLRMTAAEIAEALLMPPSTVSALLGRIGLGRRSPLEPPKPPNRYERLRAGELLHIDVKPLARIAAAGHRVTGNRTRPARGAGYEYVHVCVDDATRLAYVEVLEDQRARSAVGFLRRAVLHFAAYGITVEGVLTDNGSAYRSALHALACRALGIRHLRTRPYRPRTNGKAERFIQTLLGGWAYGAIYGSSHERTRALWRLDRLLQSPSPPTALSATRRPSYGCTPS